MMTSQSPGGLPEQAPYGFLTWLPSGMLLAGGWAGQHLLVIPRARAVVVTTGDPWFSFSPPPTDRLPADRQPVALIMVRQCLLPILSV